MPDEVNLARKKRKSQVWDVKDRDNIILNICFASVNSEFPPLQYPPKSLREAGPLFSQSICAFEHVFIFHLLMQMEIWAEKLLLLYMTSPSASTWPVIKFPQHFLEILHFLLVFHGQGCVVTSERAALHHLLDILRNEKRLMIYRKQPNSSTELKATFSWTFKKMLHSLEAAGSSFPGSEI